MSRNIIQFSIWILLVAFCPGCGTIANQDGDRKPYGGVAWDIQAMTGKQGGDMAFPLPCMILDVPFSLVGDTLFLPFDAHYTHQVNAYQEELKRNPLDPDPLTGWQSDPTVKTITAIEQDYQSYIEQLPLEQKKALIVNDHLIQSFADGSGSQAVQIKIVVYRTLWKHVLFYDQSQTRTKVMKYKKGRLIP